MKPLPAQFAVQCAGDRWFAIAPDQWTLAAAVGPATTFLAGIGTRRRMRVLT